MSKGRGRDPAGVHGDGPGQMVPGSAVERSRSWARMMEWCYPGSHRDSGGESKEELLVSAGSLVMGEISRTSVCWKDWPGLPKKQAFIFQTDTGQYRRF